MKNNEMVSNGIVSFKLSEKYAEKHPIAVVFLYLAPIIVPPFLKGAKYIVDKVAETKIECYRIKVMAENNSVSSGMIADFETIPLDDSNVG